MADVGNDKQTSGTDDGEQSKQENDDDEGKL